MSRVERQNALGRVQTKNKVILVYFYFYFNYELHRLALSYFEWTGL